jgi:hypothetical protein
MAHIVPRIACATALIVTTAVATAAPALAQDPPVIERIQVEETFPDDFLTEECGVPRHHDSPRSHHDNLVPG